MSDTQLRIGQQSEAARFLHDAAQPLAETLSELGKSLESDLEGFRGGAAAETVKAIEAWFDTAGQIFPVLEEYAQKLVAVDEAEDRTERATQERFSRLAARLGAP